MWPMIKPTTETSIVKLLFQSSSILMGNLNTGVCYFNYLSSLYYQYNGSVLHGTRAGVELYQGVEGGRSSYNTYLKHILTNNDYTCTCRLLQ